MRKLLSSILLAAAALTAQATDYTTTLSITAGAGTAEYPNTVVKVIPNGDGTSDITIKNVSYKYYVQEIPVGTIVLKNVPVTKAGVYSLMSTVQGVEIQDGDATDVSWQGPSYAALCGGQVPVYFNGEVRDGKFYGNILLDTFGAIKRTLKITLGDGAYTIGQLPNSDFEKFHTVTVGSATSDEPNSWHSFMSATGSLVGFVNKSVHTAIETSDLHAGTKGSKCVLITAGTAVMGQIPNGTITTGQMNAGAVKAESTNNHAFIDFSNESLDANNDPFYTTVDAKPDSIRLWVKFIQGTGDLATDYPYATVSAVITDGTRYQDPEADETEYKNVVAKAKNNTIESKAEWQSISIPFDYDTYLANGADANAILVTISTNATPGKGAADDKLYVDDVELVYNAKLSSLKVNGADLEGFSASKYYYENLVADKEVSLDNIEVVADGQGATVTKTITRSDSKPGEATVTITVVSADSKTVNRYTLVFSEPVDGISSVETKADLNIHANKIYTLSGQQVSKMQSGNVYVVKTADGNTVKVAKK